MRNADERQAVIQEAADLIESQQAGLQEGNDFKTQMIQYKEAQGGMPASKASPLVYKRACNFRILSDNSATGQGQNDCQFGSLVSTTIQSRDAAYAIRR